MKLILIALLSSAAMALAGQENAGIGNPKVYNPRAIYNALKVKAVVTTEPGFVGSTQYLKTVGGLSCTKNVIVVPGAVASYQCTIDQSNENFSLIYNALKIKEVRLNPGIIGVGRFEKSVGGLSCVRSVVVVPNAVPTYECTMID